MTDKTHTTATAGTDDEMLRAMLLEHVPLPDGLADRIVQDWHRQQPRRLPRWLRRPFEAGPKSRAGAFAFAACVLIAFVAVFALVAGPDLEATDQLMAPDALSELSGGLL